MRLRELAQARPRFGYLRLHVMLRREGWTVNRKRVHRIYREEGLTVRLTRRRKRASHLRVVPPRPSQVNERWSMDFVADTLLDGRRFRALTVVDNWSRHSQLIEPDFTLTGTKVVAALERVSETDGLPADDHRGQWQRIYVQGARRLGLRARSKEPRPAGRGFCKPRGNLSPLRYELPFLPALPSGASWQIFVKLDFIRPGKPVENAVIESFNGRVRDECLNAQGFVSLHDARQKIETWRIDDNEHRPHSSLGDLTRREFVEQTAQTGLQEASTFQHGVV